MPIVRGKIGATPGKLALVATLAVVLVAVIVSQLPGESDPEANALRRAGASASLKKGPARSDKKDPALAGKNQQRQDKQIWPELALEEALAHDPFAKPAWLSGGVEEETKPEVDLSREKSLVLQKMQQEGASIVVISDKNKVAEIGAQWLRVGDVVDGYLITDITPEGVVLTVPQPQ